MAYTKKGNTVVRICIVRNQDTVCRKTNKVRTVSVAKDKYGIDKIM